jgi:DNA-binding transcriptional LysR family regulator
VASNKQRATLFPVQHLDLNLLRALDVLLEEESVSKAAERMHVSSPAMSRTLSRIRASVGDEVLVRAGGSLVPTRWALGVRDRIHALVEEAVALLRHDDPTDIAGLARTFAIRANDVVAGILGPALQTAVRKKAPKTELRFVPEGDEDSADLRSGAIDLDIGTTGHLGPEMRIQRLFDDTFSGVARRGHSVLRGTMTAPRFAAQAHVSASRLGKSWGPIDDSLAREGLTRSMAMVVPSFYAALSIVAETDLVAAVPGRLAEWAETRFGVKRFTLPFALPKFTVAQVWHPRADKDPAHKWMRECVRDVMMARAVPLEKRRRRRAS